MLKFLVFFFFKVEVLGTGKKIDSVEILSWPS